MASVGEMPDVRRKPTATQWELPFDLTVEEWWEEVAFQLHNAPWADYNDVITAVTQEFGPAPGPPPEWFVLTWF